MNTRATFVRHASLLLLLVACEKDDPVERWLLCDDCAAQLNVVVGLGDDAVVLLDNALRHGPSTEARDNYRAQVAEEFRLRRRGGRGGGVVLTAADSTSFVNAALDNLIATYQKRAAFALRTLGSSAARQALRGALQASSQYGWSSDVLALVQRLETDDPITEVSVRSPVIDVPSGGTATMAVVVRGAGTVSQAVSWSVSNPALGTITPAGEFTRITPGPVRVQACSVVKPNICGFTGLGPP